MLFTLAGLFRSYEERSFLLNFDTVTFFHVWILLIISIIKDYRTDGQSKDIIADKVNYKETLLLRDSYIFEVVCNGGKGDVLLVRGALLVIHN